MGGASSQVKPPKVILQGLDAAGKTTLLYKLKLGEIVTTIPTIGFNIETLQSSHLEVTAWDVGGRCPLRPLYRHFYKQNDGFIYMLDSGDVERLDDAFEELNKSILKDSYDENRDKVVMVLANKQDLENALTPAEIETRLQMYLRKFTPDLNQTLFVMPCSSTSDDKSIWLAFDLFVQMINMKKEGRLENRFIPSAWTTAKHEDQNKETTNNKNDVTVFHRFKNSLFKDPFHSIKSVLFY